MAGTAGAILIEGLDHVVLRVRNLERALHFYREVLGCRPERRVAELGLTQLRAGNALIDLVEVDSPLGRARGSAPKPGAPNMDHFALSLRHFDEEAIRAHLEARGVAAGRSELRYGAKGTGPSLYVEDPDGNVVELKGPPEATA